MKKLAFKAMTILCLVMLVVLFGCHQGSKDQKNSKPEKVVVVQLETGNMTLSSYKLEIASNFTVDERAYLELNEKGDPLVLRPVSEITFDSKSNLVCTKWSGNYSAKLLPCKIVSIN